MPDIPHIRKRLDAVGQGHLLRFYDSLDVGCRRDLIDQIDELNLEALPGIVERYVTHAAGHEAIDELQPAPFYSQSGNGRVGEAWDRQSALARGEKLIREGKVCAFTVAGGQGSRLGFDGPKGCFPAGAVTRKPLFAFFGEAIVKASRKYGAPIAWYIMTSPQNDRATRRFFDIHRCFGVHPADVMFLEQGVLPTIDAQTGRVLLTEKGRVATNPDGHGGSIDALARSGALDDMARRGIEHISYFQVDNPIVHVLDPAFIGLHAGASDSSAQMSSKMVPKHDPEERVGVFCRSDGKLRLIEYSDLPHEPPNDLAHVRDEDGSLLFKAGSPAIHILSVEFVRRLAMDPDLALPLHTAKKNAPFVNLDTGQHVTPDEPNAVKLEKFIFDALPMCCASIVLAIDRVEQFAPIKNAEGEDSPASSARIQTERAARWLERAGVDVPRRYDGEADCTIELSPLTAVEADDLRDADLPRAIERGASVAL